MRGVAVVLLCVSAALPLRAQETVDTDSLAVAWQVVADGRTLDWSPAGTPGVDSVRHVAAEALADLRRAGHYYATMDSVALDTADAPPAVRLFVTRGPEVPLGQLRLEGVTALDTTAVRRALETRVGRPLDPSVLEADVRYLLRRYEEAGYSLARVHVDDLSVVDGDAGPALMLTLHVEEGRQLRLDGLRLEGAERTDARYVMRVAGLRRGASLQGYRAEAVRERLEATGFFDEVGEPSLEIGEGEGVTLVVPVEERPPGTFDLVVGYQPDADDGGRLVGSGHLALANALGAGREAEVELHRLPGQASRARARVADPYVLGLPFGLEASFAGLQQDSSFNEVDYGAALSYRLLRGLSVSASLSREATRPGAHGSALDPRTGRQRVPRSEVLFVGAGLRFERIDRPVNPRRGLLLEARLERGIKERSERRLAGGDTTRAMTDLTQHRLTLTGRLYVPTLPRQLVALGADLRTLRAGAYDRGDLFRFGGAATLRGYDEERFLGRAVARLLAEYRYQLDRRSYAFAFYDLGYVDRPVLDAAAGETGLYPGYGLGLQFETPLGLVTASYAVSPEDRPAEGRVHVGLSFGL